ncbi:SusC/RagA family TonB-linked outer membrane protein [Olivibacter sp. XZL3]|uniref:SusC/RagA family TonB-linked outer membrane protein n=1 Tax=Olivibacter sp. XZL3 TaxID=1735116 RepID=UPI001416F4E4|nr:SusC/RagA family TonB-linked outer membrane protein [Olivibacter sp. XZL3]
MFDWPSTVLRVGFDNYRSVAEGQSKRTRRIPEVGNTQVGKKFGNRSNLAQIILRRQPTCRQVGTMVDMTLNQGGVALRALRPYTIYLTALNVLFCVCLAHARQSSSPEAAHGVAFQKSYPITGRVLNAADDTPLDGATISIKGKQNTVLTNAEGKFRILATDSTGVLVVSYVGYQTAEIPFTKRGSNPLTIHLDSNGTQLEEVQVSTGYQTLPKERATGSFVQIDNELLNRSVSTNILDRLDGVTSGLIFNKNPESRSPITIRGNSTIMGNQEPLIVLDNFPYEGDLASINPNDIASISVLKDAAAASIWGVRAGNGVIVITTKKGGGGRTKVDFNSNLTIGERPDIFAQPQLSSQEFIALEQYLFENGNYWNINDGYSAVSPVVAMLQQRRDGLISAADSARQMDVLKGQDVREDLHKYVYRNSVNQQYALAINGGNAVNDYYLSAGYDHNRQPLVSNSFQRMNLAARNNFYFLNKRLALGTDLMLTQSETKQNAGIYATARYPYESLIGADGSHLAVVNDLRMAYVDTVGQSKLLDWHYRPLDELSPNQSIRLTDYRINLNATYRIMDGLSIASYYLYQKGVTERETINSISSYYTRNLINSYSQIDAAGNVIRPIPVGDIVDRGESHYENQSARFQANFDRTFNQVHEIRLLAGFELRQHKNFSDDFRLYGYNSETASNANASLDYSTPYPQFYGWSSLRIPARISSGGSWDRNRSFYINTSYSYRKRYMISASARRDESNLFGVKTNQRAVPLWSAGLSWDLSDEGFYHSEVLPYLKLRTSYGYNGNIDKSTTAYLTALAGTGVNTFGMNYLSISNPPNPSLRWEKVGVWNVGADFGFKNSRISGSVEYYQKKATDLIANTPLSPQAGVTQFRGNAADMLTKGVDFQLSSINIRAPFNWSSTLLLNYVKDEVISYKLRQGSNQDIAGENYINPLEGFPLYAIFSFPNRGLNDTGNPIGVLDGKESVDYAAIISNADPANLYYEGSATPVFFGSFVNTFSYGRFSMSFNITFKAGYYFRRASLNYSELPGNYSQADFSQRWQSPGDELKTNVPAMIYPFDYARETFYKYSEVLVERGDQIRLQDIRLSYTPKIGMPFSNFQVYAYANNLGLLWRANGHNIDPDAPFVPTPRSIALGLKVDF